MLGCLREGLLLDLSGFVCSLPLSWHHVLFPVGRPEIVDSCHIFRCFTVKFWRSQKRLMLFLPFPISSLICLSMQTTLCYTFKSTQRDFINNKIVFGHGFYFSKIYLYSRLCMLTVLHVSHHSTTEEKWNVVFLLLKWEHFSSICIKDRMHKLHLYDEK